MVGQDQASAGLHRERNGTPCNGEFGARDRFGQREKLRLNLGRVPGLSIDWSVQWPYVALHEYDLYFEQAPKKT